MTDFILPFYLVSLFLHQLRLFFQRWYVGSFRAYGSCLLRLFHNLERVFALRLTFRNWFLPLYQDYTLLGYAFGFIFRSLRIGVAILIYLILAVIALSFYVVWLLLPLYFLAATFAG